MTLILLVLGFLSLMKMILEIYGNCWNILLPSCILSSTAAGNSIGNSAPSIANGNLIKLVLPGMMLFLLGIIILLILVQLML